MKMIVDLHNDHVLSFFICFEIHPKMFCCATLFRSSHQEVFLGKSVLKICSKFTGEYPCRSVISIKLHSNFIEISLRHGCSVNLLHILRTPFLKNTSGWLLLKIPERCLWDRFVRYLPDLQIWYFLGL